MKKLLSLILSLTMLIGLIPAATAEEIRIVDPEESSLPSATCFFGVMITDVDGKFNTGGGYYLDYPGSMYNDTLQRYSTNNFVEEGAHVKVTAVADEGFRFVGWYEGNPDQEEHYFGQVLSTNTVYEFNAPLGLNSPFLCAVFEDTGGAPVLSLDKMSTNGIALSWTPADGKYYIQRTDAGGQFLKLVEETSFLDQEVLMGESYQYQVLVYANKTFSVRSNILELMYNPFSDVSGKKTIEYVAWAFNNGVVKGTSETTFSPDRDCSRVQFVMMLWKMHGSPEVGGTLPFSDISGAKTTKAILWALDAGVIVPAEKFRPDAPISRAEIVMILWKLAGSPEPAAGAFPFTDVSGAKTKKAVLWAYQKEITKGTSATTFAPNADCTRVQLVVFLYKYNGIYHVI